MKGHAKILSLQNPCRTHHTRTSGAGQCYIRPTSELPWSCSIPPSAGARNKVSVSAAIPFWFQQETEGIQQGFSKEAARKPHCQSREMVWRDKKKAAPGWDGLNDNSMSLIFRANSSHGHNEQGMHNCYRRFRNKKVHHNTITLDNKWHYCRMNLTRITHGYAVGT